MSLYTSVSLTGVNETPRIVTAHVRHPLIGIGFSWRVLVICRDFNQKSISRPGAEVSALCFHPILAIMVSGWSDGCLSLWEATCETTVKAPAHEGKAVCDLCWTSAGGLLVSASNSGHLAFWQLGSRASGGKDVPLSIAHQLTIVATANTEGVPRQLVHLSLFFSGDTQKSLNENSIITGAYEFEKNGEDSGGTLADASTIGDDRPVFALLCRPIRSAIYVVEDTGARVRVAVECAVELEELFWCTETQMLIALTKDFALVMYSLLDNVEFAEVMAPHSLIVRNSLRPHMMGFSACWLPSGRLAVTGGEDKIVIFCTRTQSFDIFSLSETVLSPSTSSESVKSCGVSIVSLACFTNQQNDALSFGILRHAHMRQPLVALGTDGALYICCYVKTSSKASLSVIKVMLPQAGIPRQVLVACKGTLCICTEQAVFFTREKRLFSKASYPAVALQRSQRNIDILLPVESEKKNSKDDNIAGAFYLAFSLTVDVPIITCDFLYPYVAITDGLCVIVYKFDGDSKCKQQCNIPCLPGPFTLHKEGIILHMQHLSESCIFLRSIENDQTFGKFPLEPEEGSASCIDVSGDFVCLVTTKHIVKVAKIVQHEFRLIFPPRSCTFTDNGAAVIVSKCRINAMGTMIALLINISVDVKEHFGCTPGEDIDSRVKKLFVLDLKANVLRALDLSTTNGIPLEIAWNSSFDTANLLPAPVTDISPRAANTPSEQCLQSSFLAVEVYKRIAASQLGSQMDGVTGGENQGRQALNMEQSPRHSTLTFFIIQDDTQTASTSSALSVVNSGIFLHSTKPVAVDCDVQLVGCSIPHLIVRDISSGTDQVVVSRKFITDFKGINSSDDPSLRHAIMLFSYYSAIGEMGAAYSAIQSIKDPAAWKSLSKVCIATRRCDVATVCLAHLQSPVAAGLLNYCGGDCEAQVALGILAVSLGMHDEAETVFRDAGRSDLVIRLLLARGQWDAAQDFAKLNSSIETCMVSFERAQYYEDIGNFASSADLYTEASSAATEIPRLLLSVANDKGGLRTRVLKARAILQKMSSTSKGITSVLLNELKDINGKGDDEASKDVSFYNHCTADADSGEQNKEINPARFEHLKDITDLVRWWAHCMEKQGNIDNALKLYALVEDAFSIVRVLLNQTPKNVGTAVRIFDALTRTGAAKGAGILLGKHFEEEGDIQHALLYYQASGAVRSAASLARRNNLVSEVASIIMQAPDSVTDLPMLAAHHGLYLEEKGEYDKAVALYRRTNQPQLAINACIKGGLFEQLHNISASFDAETDPASFLSMAEHFLRIKEYDKAVEMLIFGKAYVEALELCATKNVRLTDSMAESMVVAAKDDDSDAAVRRTQILLEIARVAEGQGSFVLACKKYTQAGERVHALKMLIRAGDAEKVLFFAQHSRSAEIYVLAANFLQCQNWREDAKWHKAIVSLYTKAKAYESLARFHESAAQVHIDEYRDYDRALTSLQSASAALQKEIAASDSSDLTAVKERIEKRILLTQLLVSARQSIKPGEESPDSVRMCNQLIEYSKPGHQNQRAINQAIHIGDVYALLVEYYFRLEKWEDAFLQVQLMKEREIDLSCFLEEDLIRNICSHVSKPIGEYLNNNGKT